MTAKVPTLCKKITLFLEQFALTHSEDLRHKGQRAVGLFPLLLALLFEV